MALTRNRLIGNLANATDSAASSSFLAKGATEANYQSIAYSDVTGKPTILDSAGITSIIDSSYVQARQGSAVAGLDSAGITSLVDSNYVVARAAASGSGYGRYNYTATAGQTVFQDSDNSGAVLSYTSGGIMVFYNGVMLKNTSDWEGTDGSSVTLVEAADSGANVSIHKWTVAGGGSSGGGSGPYDRGILSGGFPISGSDYTIIDYWDIATLGNTSDFGDLTVGRYHLSSVSNSTYVVHVSGQGSGGSLENTMDYITVATTSNATDFGDDTLSRHSVSRGNCSNGTYGLIGGGYGAIRYSQVSYITIATPGNAGSFGTLSQARTLLGTCSDTTYGVFAGGYNGSSNVNVMDYVTIGTSGSSSDFGDLSAQMNKCTGCSDNTYGHFTAFSTATQTGLNSIEYITIATPSNSTDFGDLTTSTGEGEACSNNTYGNLSGKGTFGSAIAQIDYWTMATPSNASDFGDLTGTPRSRGTSNSGSPS